MPPRGPRSLKPRASTKSPPMDDFRVYHTVDQALCNQLIEATPPTYLQTVKDPLLGFGQISTLAILTHLRNTYGTITPEELDKNDERMAAAWHPPTPIEDLFEQLIGWGRNSLPKEAMPPRPKPKCVSDTSSFSKRDCSKKWDRDPRRLLETAATAGYHGAANQVSATNAHHQEASIANQAERAALRIQLAALTTAMAAVDVASRPGSPTAFLGTTASLAGSVITQATTVHPNALTNNSYCWTHGISRNRAHTSISTCEHPAEGHQTAATLDNQMGGSTRVWGEAARRTPC
eukprot:scaffold76012_cov52-Attheya_sp.AAC.3